ncbi:MAG TPA: hypothetical protein VF614_17720 [Chthoniobacteraceae bacterium]|jgi:hypothetical protein
MLTQIQADRLVALLKEAARKEVFVWQENRAQTELFVAVQDERIQFKLSMKRNPFEIRLHLRTRDRDIGLIRLDAAPFHTNPDGRELRNQPHLHMYREGFGLEFAEPVHWHDPANPTATVERFLEEIRGRFPLGYELALL